MDPSLGARLDLLIRPPGRRSSEDLEESDETLVREDRGFSTLPPRPLCPD